MDLPTHIIVYRNGFQAREDVREEIAHIKVNSSIFLAFALYLICSDFQAACFEQHCSPKIAFLLVTSPKDTRFFKENVGAAPGFQIENVDRGTVVDNTVTMNNRKDFFLVSKKTPTDTAIPTYYNIVHDDANLSADIHQELANQLTGVYFNTTVIIVFF